MFLHEIGKPKGARKKKKIVGRGQGSGSGQTAGRGEKGQKSRSGRAIIHGLEGGQMPLIRRLPKVGFRVRHKTVYQLVNLDMLSKIKEGTEVSPEVLKNQGLVKSDRKPIKVLGVGEIKKPLTIKVHAFSKSAETKVSQAGGKIEKINIKNN